MPIEKDIASQPTRAGTDPQSAAVEPHRAHWIALWVALAVVSGLVHFRLQAGWAFHLDLLVHPVLGLVAFALVMRPLLRPGGDVPFRARAEAWLAVLILAAVAPLRTGLIDRVAVEHADWVDNRVVVPVVVIGAALALRGLPALLGGAPSRLAKAAALAALLAWMIAIGLGLAMLVPTPGRHDWVPPSGGTLAGLIAGYGGWLLVTVLVTGLALLEIVRRLGATASRFPLSLWLGFAILCALVPLRREIATRTGLPSEAVDGRVSLPAVVVASLLIVRGVWRRDRSARDRKRALGAGLVLLPSLVLVSLTWVVLLRPGSVHDRRLYNIHTLWAAIAVVSSALALWVAAGERLGRIRWRAVGLAAAGTAALAFAGEGLLPSAAPGVVNVSTSVTAATLGDGHGALGRAADSGWLGLSASCGGERGCHGEIVAESRRSLHGAGARRLRALPVGATLAASAGCVACHTPSAPSLVAGNTDTDGDAREAIDCVLCHRTTDATVDPPWESRYSVGLMGGLLAPFRDAARAGRPLTGFGRYAIGLEGAAHGRTFSPPVVSEDRFCQSCHHLQLRVLVAGIRCVDCHMPEAQALGGVGSHRSHVFPGANVAAAVQLGDEGLVSVQSAWTRGACVASVPRLRDVPGEAETPVPAAALSEPCLGMTVALTASAQDRLRLTVTTSNAWMTHPFPAGSFDRLEAWLEIRVADEQGRVVYASGLRGEADGLDASVHRLGLPGGARVEPGSALGAGGAAVRVWHGTTSSGAAVILPGDSRGDVFEWADSRGASVGRLLVSARWLYRKTDAAWWSSEGGRGAVPALVVGERTEWLAPAPEPRGEMA